MKSTMFAVTAAIIMSLVGTQTIAAPKGDLRATCRAKASDSVGGDTYRQGKRAGAIFRSCMSSGGKG